MKKAIISLAFGAALLSPVASAHAFEGVYLAPEIGYGSLKIKLETDSGDFSDSKGGVSYGLIGGYRFETGNWVLGIEGRVGKTDANGTFLGVEEKAGREFTISGLVGYDLGGAWTIFATLGYDNLKFTESFMGVTASDTTDGAAVSLGAEYDISSSVALRGTLTGVAYTRTIGPDYKIKPTQSRGTVSAVFHF